MEDVTGTVMDRVLKFATDIPGLNFISIAVTSLTTDNKNVKDMIQGAAKSFLVTTGMFVLSLATEVAGSAVRRAASVAVNNYVRNLGSTAVRIANRSFLTAAAMTADKAMRQSSPRAAGDVSISDCAADDTVEDLQGGDSVQEKFDIVHVAEQACCSASAAATSRDSSVFGMVCASSSWVQGVPARCWSESAHMLLKAGHTSLKGSRAVVIRIDNKLGYDVVLLDSFLEAGKFLHLPPVLLQHSSGFVVVANVKSLVAAGGLGCSGCITYRSFFPFFYFRSSRYFFCSSSSRSATSSPTSPSASLLVYLSPSSSTTASFHPACMLSVSARSITQPRPRHSITW